MFIRFVVDEKDEESLVSRGVFQAAFQLRDSGKLSVSEMAQLRELGSWFDDNLKKPRKLSCSRSKARHKARKAISWFRDSAASHIENIRPLVEILRCHGAVVTMIKTDRPGYVVYEDEFQVVAEPFKDTEVDP